MIEGSTLVIGEKNESVWFAYFNFCLLKLEKESAALVDGSPFTLNEGKMLAEVFKL